MYSLRDLTQPAVFPVTLAQAKAFASVDPSFTGDDSLITSLISAGTYEAESFTHRAFFNRSVMLGLDRFPIFFGNETKNITDTVQFPFTYFFNGLTIQLPKPGCVSVTSINYTDQTGTIQTMDPATYIVDLNSEPARLVPANMCYWPTNICSVYSPGNVQITYQAGTYGDGVTVNHIPGNVVTAICLYVSYFYTNREGATDVPQAFYRLLESIAFRTFGYASF
jgi:hypothetical protein